MPETFQYKVKDKNGKLVEGSLEAENAQLVVSKLRSMSSIRATRLACSFPI